MSYLSLKNIQSKNHLNGFYEFFSHDTFQIIHIEDLHTITDANFELAVSLTRLFEKCLNQYYAEYYEAETFNEKMHAAHALKGACRSIAAHDLSNILQQLEQDARNEQESSKELLSEFETIVSQCHHYLQILETRYINR